MDTAESEILEGPQPRDLRCFGLPLLFALGVQIFLVRPFEFAPQLLLVILDTASHWSQCRQIQPGALSPTGGMEQPHLRVLIQLQERQVRARGGRASMFDSRSSGQFVLPL